MLDFKRFESILNVISDRVVICRESATYFQDLSTYPPLPLHLTRKGCVPFTTDYVCMYEDNYGFEDTEILEGHKVTNKERTIMELIKHDCDREVINQALVSYFYDYNGKEDTLRSYADKYEVDKTTLIDYIKEAHESFNPDWC